MIDLEYIKMLASEPNRNGEGWYCCECGSELRELIEEIERLQCGLRAIWREFGHKPINNGRSTLGLFIDQLISSSTEAAKRQEVSHDHES